MTPPNIDNFNIENKEDSAAKLAQASGQPTKYFLFAEEFNSIKTYFAHLKQKIVEGFNNISFQSVTTGEGKNVTTNPVILKKSEDEFIIIDSTTGQIQYWNKLLNLETPTARYQTDGNFYIANDNNFTFFSYEDGFLWLKDNNGYRWQFSDGEMTISSEDNTIVARYGYTQFQLTSLDTETLRHEIVTGNSTGIEVSKRPATPLLGAKESIKTLYNSIVRTYWNYEFEVNVINEFFLPDMADGWNGKLATEEHVTNAILQLIDGAPSDGNTLKELNDKIVAIKAIIGGTTADGDSLVNTVAELLAVFSTYPEGTDIATVLAGKLNKTDVIESLTQVVAGKALDATQGKVLYDLIVALSALVGGKLDKQMSAYTLMANNSNASANGSAHTFKAIANQVYTGTPVWTGSSAPSGSNDHSYSWAQIGNLVTLRINLVYGVGGSTITAVTIPLPSDCPSPFVASGGTPANNRLISVGTGIMQTNFAPSTVPSYVVLQTNSTNTGFNILVQRASANYQMVTVTVTYLTT